MQAVLDDDHTALPISPGTHLARRAGWLKPAVAVAVAAGTAFAAVLLLRPGDQPGVGNGVAAVAHVDAVSNTVTDFAAADSASPTPAQSQRLASYMVAHSQFSTPMGRRNVWTSLLARSGHCAGRVRDIRGPLMGIARPALALSLLAALCPVAHATPEEARAWLERMCDALATRKYDGLFTHSNRRQTETMRIVHRMEGASSVERLVSLDGSGREIVRTPREVHAYLPDRRVVLVEPRTDDGSLLKALPTPGAELDAQYLLEVRGGSRLLGRNVRIIEIRPRDAYRYGYRLWLDEKIGHAAAVGDLRPDGSARGTNPVHASSTCIPICRPARPSRRWTHPVFAGCARRGQAPTAA